MSQDCVVAMPLHFNHISEKVRLLDEKKDTLEMKHVAMSGSFISVPGISPGGMDVKARSACLAHG